MCQLKGSLGEQILSDHFALIKISLATSEIEWMEIRRKAFRYYCDNFD